MINLYSTTNEILQNEEIILYKINHDDYDITYLDNETIKLTKKIKILNYITYEPYDYISSTILNCLVNNTLVTKLNYNNILNHIYNIIDDGVLIIKSSIMNIKTIELNDKGYKYIPTLGISVQCAAANKMIREIITQCYVHNIKIDIKIKLNTNETINIII